MLLAVWTDDLYYGAFYNRLDFADGAEGLKLCFFVLRLFNP